MEAGLSEEGVATTAVQEMKDVLGLVHNEQAAKAGRPGLGEMEEESGRRSKWPKQQFPKGNSGKGHPAWDNWSSHRDDWFREPDSELGLKTQGLLTALVRLAIRHEAELSKIRIDTTYMFYLDTGAGGILPQVRKVATQWQAKFEEKQVRSPLGTILLLSIFEEVLTKIGLLLEDTARLQKAKDWGWIQDGLNGPDPLWTYFQWNPEARKQEPSAQPAIKNSEVQTHLKHLQVRLAEPGVLTLFKATRPMSSTDRYASAVLPFICTLSLRSQVATQSHAAIAALVNNSALKLIGARIRPARGERQPLSDQLEKAYLAVPWTEWRERRPAWTREPATQPDKESLTAPGTASEMMRLLLQSVCGLILSLLYRLHC